MLFWRSLRVWVLGFRQPCNFLFYLTLEKKNNAGCKTLQPEIFACPVLTRIRLPVFCIIDKQAMGNDYANTVKISWLSQMHSYLTYILLVKTSKHSVISAIFCVILIKYKKMGDLVPYRLLFVRIANTDRLAI